MIGHYSLKGKNAVVTGAGAGIGRAIALASADAGAQVACVDLDLNVARATAAEVTKPDNVASPSPAMSASRATSRRRLRRCWLSFWPCMSF